MLLRISLKTFGLLAFILFVFTANATNYYLSTSGNDANSGTDPSSPWQTLNKLNSFKNLQPGDNVLFKRGDSFYGSITVSNSGTAGNPITFSAYGTGENPVISGFTNVTSWTNKGGNIWESTNEVSTLSTCNIVVVNGANTPMGRTPNSGFYTYQTHNANLSITSSDLTGAPNWTGAQAVIKKEAWLFHRAIITSQSAGRISYTDEFIDGYVPRDGWGFFIQNDLRTLDTTNEWYYNPSTHKIEIYSIGEPTGIKVASQKILVTNNNRKYITFDNLNICGADSIALYMIGANNSIVQNCNINHSGYHGIAVDWSDSYIITNNVIRCCGDCGIRNGTHDTNTKITSNVIDSTSMINGINGEYAGAAIYGTGTPSLVQYNSIDHSGYNGILPNDKSEIRNNFINNSCLKRTDGAGIYCGGAYTSILFDGNIILNSFGNTSGTTGLSEVGAEGIYLDINTTNVIVSNNTCANNRQFGIMVSRSHNNTITGNTCFNNGISQMEFENWSGTNDVYKNVMNNNLFVAKASNQFAFQYRSSINNIQGFGTALNNIYARPIDDSITIRTGQPSEYTNGGEYKTLAQWKTWTGQDANSYKLTKTITDTSQLRFEYNADSVSKKVLLSYNYADLTGINYNGSIILPPFTSVILIKNGPIINQQPIANAGTDQILTLPDNSVKLSGSASNTDGAISIFQWTKISGPSSYNIGNPISLITDVTGLTEGVYQFELKVTDNGATGKDTVTITVNPQQNIPPKANAGSNQTITLPVSSTILTGSATDSDGHISNYLWEKISGPTNYQIENPNSAIANITGLTVGTYQFQLTVTDDKGAIASSTVQITVNPPLNIPPAANAGLNQIITLSTNQISLNGSGKDSDGTIESYLWTKISGPSSGTINNANSVSATINDLLEGIYQFELKVTDDKGGIGRDTIQVTVNAAPNIAPTANAGADKAITLPTNSVSISGSGTDSDGTISSYSWTKISGPSAYNISNSSSGTTTISGLDQGVYLFELKVTDDKGAIAKDTVQITVNAAPNIPPTANAGSDKAITLPTNSVSLTGAGTDSDGTISSYSWTKISGPSAYNISNSSSGTNTISGLDQGVYLFELKVTDDKGAIAKDTVQITVNAAPNIPPTANVGSDKTITLPSNLVSLTGAGTDSDETISSYSWTKISGPSAYNISNSSSGTTTISGLVQGVYLFELKVTDDKGAIAKDTVQITVNAAPNIAPTANAGADKAITLPTNSVSISGSGTDPDGSISSYSWTKISGPSSGTINNANYASATINNLSQGVYQFELKVTDDKGAIGKDTVLITVNAAPNMPPTANAGADKTITLPTNSVSLSGSGTDADGTISSYSWTKISGPSSGAINNANSAFATINNLLQGIYQFELKVTDDKGGIGHDTVQVTVNTAPNIAPTANAGLDKTITLPTNSVSLSGSGADSDGTISSYFWTKISGPSAYNVLNSTSAFSTVTGLVQGVYLFELKVTDDKGGIAKDTVQITVNAAPNIALTANAGSDKTITLPTNSVPLSGSGTDANGSIASYSWTKISGPSAYNISNSSSGTTTISGLDQGVYQFELKVTDDKGAIAKDTVQITVNAAPNIPPTANAGSDKTITLPSNSVSLTGAGTDSDGTISSYSWTKISGPSAYNISNSSSGTNTISGLVQGMYLFELKVTDDKGAIAKDTVQITVNAAPNIPPTANAGADKAITLPTNSVSISGSGTDPDGSISSYSWTKISGPSAYNVLNSTSAVSTVSGLVQGVYLFELKVTDDKGGIGRDTVQVTVNAAPNIALTANAGSDKTITLPTNSVSLSGSGTDADGSIASYSWTKISGPSAYNISNSSSGTTTISGLDQGVYQFELKVTDDKGAIAKDTVQITVNAAPNIPPTANAGSDKTITLPTNSVTLSGSGTDTDGTISSYSWTEISGPSAYDISNSSSGTNTISGLVQGVYLFELKVTDDKGAIAKDTVQIIVNAAPNIPPTAKAGTDKTITLPTDSVSLSGSGTDTDGSISSYSWTKISGPSSYNILNSISAVSTISGLVQGVYQFELSVTDDKGSVGLDTVQITVDPAPNVPPTAKAGIVQTITLPANSITLNGNGKDSDGTVSSYLWEKIAGPEEGRIMDSSLPSTTVKGLIAGNYIFKLTVTDNEGAKGTDSVHVMVNAAKNIAPLANAGPDITIVLPVNSVYLNGIGNDVDGRVIAYKWKQISGPDTALISTDKKESTVVKNLVAGTYQFEVTVMDSTGETGKDTVMVVVALGRVSPEPNSIKIYPNPVKDIANVEITSENINSQLMLIISDFAGKMVYKKQMNSSDYKTTEKINMSALSKGSYAVTVFFDGKDKQVLTIIKE